MPKRRRLFTPIRHKTKINSNFRNETNEYDLKDSPNSGSRCIVREMSTARGRLQGALMEVLDPTTEDSDESLSQTPMKRDRQSSNEHRSNSTDDDERQSKHPHRHSYVLKLFDRSVDLSQFSEDSPLYPICRAWIVNKPKADYSQLGKKYNVPDHIEGSVELPGPNGPPVSKIPELLSEQRAANKDNINLNYDYESALPSKEQLLQRHVERWSAIREAWITQSQKAESRYAATQEVLTKINVKYGILRSKVAILRINPSSTI